MPIVLYNTLSGKKEALQPSAKPTNIFVCGPTVYDHLHIGNARTFAFFDTLVKYLKSEKYKVFYLQNITDIDDKIIERAKKEDTGWKKIALKYENIFRRDMKALHITAVTRYARASRFIPQIVRQIKTLIDKGHVYQISGDARTGQPGGWYFDLKTFPDYGKLAGRTIEAAEDGVSRIDRNTHKRNAGDFCVWKSAPQAEQHGLTQKKYAIIDGEPAWNTELGWGRPGWHIEDTAITEHFFGPQYDIHGAARDLIFPHHEAEIAQAESASGKKPFVKIWMHGGLMTVEAGTKMSKSLGNFITVEKLLKETDSNVFRLVVAGVHYRSPLEWSASVIRDAHNALSAIEEFLMKINMSLLHKGQASRVNAVAVSKYSNEFSQAMNDDVNTPKALSAIFKLINDTNKIIYGMRNSDLKSIKRWLLNSFLTLGIDIKPLKIPLKIKKTVQKRELFRSNKQFAESDSLRKKIEALGYRIEDTPIGPLVLKK